MKIPKKIPKVTLVSAIIFLAVAIILFLLPILAISQISSAMGSYSAAPAYKLAEAIELWHIYLTTIFQPLAIISFVVSAILFIYTLIRWITLNYGVQTRVESET